MTGMTTIGPPSRGRDGQSPNATLSNAGGGYRSKGGRENAFRGGQEILKDTVDGVVILAFDPPAVPLTLPAPIRSVPRPEDGEAPGEEDNGGEYAEDSCT